MNTVGDNWYVVPGMGADQINETHWLNNSCACLQEVRGTLLYTEH